MVGSREMLCESGRLDGSLPEVVLDREELLFKVPATVNTLTNSKKNRDNCARNQEEANNICQALELVGELFCVHSSTDSLLISATRLIVEALDVEHCGIGWLDSDEMILEVRASSTRDGAMVSSERVTKVFADLIKSTQRGREKSASAEHGVQRGRQLKSATQMVLPLRIDKQIVGYALALKGDGATQPFLDSERSLFFAMCRQISTALEVQRTREYLEYPYVALAQRSMEEEGTEGAWLNESPASSRIDKSEMLLKGVARRFFADLRKAGFESSHIIDVATEILDNVLGVLQKA